MAFELSINTSRQLFIDGLALYVNPGETMTLQASFAANTQLDCSLGWKELW